ncbi:MAG: alpha/beta hydrolase [Pseudomonadales bacterium]|nr:alpha/beta hydrolase [Pseudomonadales bacterium]
MKISYPVISAIVMKDFRGLFPLVSLTVMVLTLDIIVTEFYQDTDSPLLSFLVIYLPQLSKLVACLLLLVAFVQDPAISLSHDWLTRPIAKIDLLLAKLLLVGMVVLGPLVVFGFFASFASGYSIVESLLRATSIESWWMLLVLPFVFMFAFISGSVTHALGNVLAAFVALSVPAVFTPALPINPDAVGDDAMTLGIMWILLYPIGIGLIALIGWVYWLQYQGKKRRQAVLATCAGVMLTLVLVMGSFSQSAWPTLLRVQQSVVNDNTESLMDDVVLDGVFGCFPSSVIGQSSSGASADNQGTVGAGYWSQFLLNRAGAGSITFATNVRARQVPEDWRLVMLHSKAIYNANSVNRPIELRPARFTNANPYGTSENVATHFWMLPHDSLQTIQHDASTQLTLQYTGALLSPMQHELATDNIRRHVPGIGYCSAGVDDVNNVIDVDCFKRGPQPALVAAELINVESSRVDSLSPNYSPGWIEFLAGKHYELQIQSPNLVDHSKILLTAYTMEEVLTKEISFAGILGAETATCEVPALDKPLHYAQSSWSDSSPHEVSYISVEPGVRLEVLDWGGQGRSLVLLAGGGATAHSYDSLAEKLAADYRVIGITRRGFGASSAPDYGYDMDRLGEDVMQVIEAMNIESPILVGHSLAGDELSTLGAKYPERFSGLIYLDAAYDRSGEDLGDGEIYQALPPAPPPVPADTVSYETVLAYLQRIEASPLPEGEFIASYELQGNGFGQRQFDRRIGQALMADIPPPDYANIPLPALAIYNVETSPESYMQPWYDKEDAAIRQHTTQLYELRNPYKLAEINKFDTEMPNSEVVVLEDSSHSLFLSHEAEVLEVINRFIQSLD